VRRAYSNKASAVAFRDRAETIASLCAFRMSVRVMLHRFAQEPFEFRDGEQRAARCFRWVKQPALYKPVNGDRVLEPQRGSGFLSRQRKANGR